MIYRVKGFGIVNETEIDVFLEFPSFLCDPANAGNLISGSSAFSKPSLDIWKFLVHVMLKPSMQDFEHDLTSMGNECNCLMVWTFFSTPLLGNWDEDWPFPVLWPLLGKNSSNTSVSTWNLFIYFFLPHVSHYFSYCWASVVIFHPHNPCDRRQITTHSKTNFYPHLRMWVNHSLKKY